MEIAKPTIMLKNSLLPFRIFKQNWNIFIGSTVIDIFVNHILGLLSERSKFCDDVISFCMTSSTFFFFLKNCIMMENICTKFHGHSSSRSKIIEGGRFYPPLGIQKSKKLGANRVNSIGFINLGGVYRLYEPYWTIFEILDPQILRS